MTTIPLADIATNAVIGADMNGDPLTWNRNHSPNLVIGGKPGSGKGGTERVLQTIDVATGNPTIICAPMKSAEYRWATGAVSIATTPAGIVRALRHAVTTIQERNRVLDTWVDPVTGIQGLERYTDLPVGERWRPLTVYLAEAAMILRQPSPWIRSKEAQEQATADFVAIVTTGRSVGVHLVLTVQRPLKGFLFGGNKDANGAFDIISGRIHCDRDPDSLYSMFDGGAKIPKRVLGLISVPVPGRVAYQFLDPADSDEVRAGQIVWVTKEQAHHLAQAYTGPAPIDFDNPTKEG